MDMLVGWAGISSVLLSHNDVS